MTDIGAGLLVGIDVGGTFTDVVVRDERTGAMRVAKVPSTPADQAQGFMEGLHEVGAPPEDVVLLIHGTTVATNAAIERKGARCLLVTTRGFRDVLELGRRDRPNVYGLDGSVHPLIPRDRRIEVDERTRHDGRIEIDVSPEAVIAAVAPHIEDVEAIVVSFLHSYANPANEQVACDAIRARWPDLYTIGAGLTLPMVGEFERTSTAAVHAYVQPIMRRYLLSLAKEVDAAGYARRPAVVQCNGGIMALEHAVERPANTVRSGPAAGVIAGAALAYQAGYANAITGDVGGTSFDVALVVDGQPVLTEEKLIDFRIPVRVPTIDVETIGAGGGSLARIDDAGILQVGPESAGAVPGPACYGRGGTRPTVTDANVALGRIDPSRPIGGKRLDLDRDLSIAAIRTQVAEPLGISVEEAAEAILRVVDSRMAGQARLMSVGRGHDPRDFAYVPFGGAGPLHGAAIILEVGIPRAIVPPFPGVTSAIGCIEADVQYDFLLNVGQRLPEIDLNALSTEIEGRYAEGRALIGDSAVPVTAIDLVVEAEMHFDGQRHPISVRLPMPLDDHATEAAFRAAYELRYGAVLEGTPVVVQLTARVIGRRPHREAQAQLVETAPWDAAIDSRRPVFFEGAWHETPVLLRDRLAPGMHGSGPAIVEQPDTTTVVPPGFTVRVDQFQNLVMEVQA
jgi:N-methylhydantoinase A